MAGTFSLSEPTIDPPPCAVCPVHTKRSIVHMPSAHYAAQWSWSGVLNAVFCRHLVPPSLSDVSAETGRGRPGFGPPAKKSRIPIRNPGTTAEPPDSAVGRLRGAVDQHTRRRGARAARAAGSAAANTHNGPVRQQSQRTAVQGTTLLCTQCRVLILRAPSEARLRGHPPPAADAHPQRPEGSQARTPTKSGLHFFGGQ